MLDCPSHGDTNLAAIICNCASGGTSLVQNIVAGNTSSTIGDFCSLSQCFALCPNADLAGIGVRVAFYAQSVMNALLVFISPEDSLSSAWAAACLVTSLVIPAIVQKVTGNLTLHHATLVFNFATLSCISSLAVAPKLPIWRLRRKEYAAYQLARRATRGTKIVGPSGQVTPASIAQLSDIDPKKFQHDQSKQRLILSLALLSQVALQWTWGIILFVSPEYSQTECSNHTQLRLFFARKDAQHVNDHQFLLWVAWILFCLFLTLLWTIALAISGPSQAHDTLSRTSTMSSRSEATHGTRSQAQLRRTDTLGSHVSHALRELVLATRRLLPCFQGGQARSSSAFLIYLNYTAAFALWLALVIASERQRVDNCIFQGEETVFSFGQLAAILLAAQPLWSLTVAFYKYPSMRRREERKLQRQLLEADYRQRLEVLDRENPESEHINARGARMPSHARFASSTSVTSETAPLIPDTIPHGRALDLRLPRYGADSDSEID